MTDPQALLRALYRRLDRRAFRELKTSNDETRDALTRETAMAAAVACKAVSEELLLVLTEPVPEERT